MDRPDRRPGPPVDSARLQLDDQAYNSMTRPPIQPQAPSTTTTWSAAGSTTMMPISRRNSPRNVNASSVFKLMKNCWWPYNCTSSPANRGIDSHAS